MKKDEKNIGVFLIFLMSYEYKIFIKLNLQ